MATHAAAFRELFENRCQFQHFQQYLTGLLVLDNKSLANIARCVLASADKTDLSRFLSAAPWQEAAVNDRRISYLLAQTVAQRRSASASALLLDDTLCEHVGGLFAHSWTIAGSAEMVTSRALVIVVQPEKTWNDALIVQRENECSC